MTKQTQTKANKAIFEKAEKPVPFLEGEYFRGLCEVAYASEKGLVLYPTKANEGIILSVFHKGIVEMASLKDGGRMFQNFDYSNRYLIENGEKKEENILKFKEIIAEIQEKGLTVFSTEPVAEPTLSASDLF